MPIAKSLVAVAKTPESPWPSQKSIELALILFIAGQGGEVVFKGQPREDTLIALADHFGISQRQRKLPHSTAGTKWSNKVQWAKLGLSRGGKLVAGNSRSTWVLDAELLALVVFVQRTGSIAVPEPKSRKKKVKVA